MAVQSVGTFGGFTEIKWGFKKSRQLNIEARTVGIQPAGLNDAHEKLKQWCVCFRTLIQKFVHICMNSHLFIKFINLIMETI